MKAEEFYKMYDIEHPKKCLPREDEMCEKLSQEIEDLIKQLNQKPTVIVDNAGVKKWVYFSLVIGFMLAGGYVGMGLIKDVELNRLRIAEARKTQIVEKQGDATLPFIMGAITSFAFYKILDK